MVASPFFTSGRSAILPTIANKEELHTANSLTQTTQWTTLTIGTFLGGTSVMQFGYKWAFAVQCPVVSVFGAVHFAPARAGRRLSGPPRKRALTEDKVVRPWHEYAEGLRYMRGVAADPGHRAASASAGPPAAARRRSCSACFGELVFNRGPAGIGYLWAAAGVGLLARRNVRALAGQAAFRSAITSAPSASATWCTAARTSSSARCAVSTWRCCFIAHLARGGGGQLGAEHVATAAARFERISRPRVCDHGNDAVVGDDAFDGWRRHRLQELEPAHASAPFPECSAPARRSSGCGPIGPDDCRSRRARAWSRKKSKFMAIRWSRRANGRQTSRAGDRRGQAHRPRHRAAPGSKKATRVAIHYGRSEKEARAHGRRVRRRRRCSSANLESVRRNRAPVCAKSKRTSAASTAWSTTPPAFTASIRSTSPKRDWDFIHSREPESRFFCCQQGARL